MTIKSDVQSLEPGAIIELYELDATSIGGDVVRFHQHLQQGSIWWQGVEYTPWPVKMEGFAKTTDQPPTPRMVTANINGSISALCRLFDDLVGSKVSMRRTLVQYLDAVNFPGANVLVDPTFEGSLVAWNPISLDRVEQTDNGIRLSTDTGWPARVARQAIGTTNGEQYVVTLDIAENTTTALGGLRITMGNAAGDASYGTVMVPGGFMGRWRTTITAGANDFWLNIQVNEEDRAVTLRQAQVQVVGENPTADPTQQFTTEIWYVERKSAENKEAVEFELVSAMDLNGLQLPRRQIVANHCPFVAMGGYRGPYCGYTGPPVAKRDDTPTSNPLEDDCGGKISSCKLRQWPDGVLNFGGFPAAGLMRT